MLVGTKKALSFAIRNLSVLKRNTKLKERLNALESQSAQISMAAESDTSYGKKT